MTVRTAAFAALVSAALVLAGGCSTTSSTAGGGTATFNKATGNLSSMVEAPLDEAYDAAQGAVEDLEFRLGSKSKDALTGVINAETATGDDIKITLNKQSDTLTEVTVGMGPLGKESTARLLLDKIQERLK